MITNKVLPCLVWDIMHLVNELSDSSDFFSIGFDFFSKRYLMKVDDGIGNTTYYFLTHKQYIWARENLSKLKYLYRIIKKNKKNMFFSNFEKNNSYDQNRVMWEYAYRDMLLNKQGHEIRERIGLPDKKDNSGRWELYLVSQKLALVLFYNEYVCCDIKFIWTR